MDVIPTLPGSSLLGLTWRENESCRASLWRRAHGCVRCPCGQDIIRAAGGCNMKRRTTSASAAGIWAEITWSMSSAVIHSLEYFKRMCSVCGRFCNVYWRAWYYDKNIYVLTQKTGPQDPERFAGGAYRDTTIYSIEVVVSLLSSL